MNSDFQNVIWMKDLCKLSHDQGCGCAESLGITPSEYRYISQSLLYVAPIARYP
jgi:hypothetical protein